MQIAEPFPQQSRGWTSGRMCCPVSFSGYLGRTWSKDHMLGNALLQGLLVCYIMMTLLPMVIYGKEF